jgi:hypothetical protein
MERCPACGGGLTEARGVAREDPEETRVVGYHGSPRCWMGGYSLVFARAVGRILEQEGEKLRLAAHP